MGKISQKKENKKSVTLAAISGAVNDGVSKTGQAIKEHLVAFSGGDSCGLPPDLKASTSLSNLPRAVKGEYYEHYNHPLVVNVFTIKGLM